MYKSLENSRIPRNSRLCKSLGNSRLYKSLGNSRLCKSLGILDLLGILEF